MNILYESVRKQIYVHKYSICVMMTHDVFIIIGIIKKTPDWNIII